METIDLYDDEPPTVTKEPNAPITTCSAPSTPTGERDPPVAFRRPSISATNDELPQVEVDYRSSTDSNDNNSLIGFLFGCLKPMLCAFNKIGENIKSTRDTKSVSSKTKDDWEIPIDNIIDLVLIGTGIEGKVYLGKFCGQNVACKRVKSQEETNIKHLKKLNHVNVVKFRGLFCISYFKYVHMYMYTKFFSYRCFYIATIILYCYGILCIRFII